MNAVKSRIHINRISSQDIGLKKENSNLKDKLTYLESCMRNNLVLSGFKETGENLEVKFRDLLVQKLMIAK
jgi:hypothetical protein